MIQRFKTKEKAQGPSKICQQGARARSGPSLKSVAARFSGMRGQSTVEYILVLAVVISLGITLLGRSSIFQKYLANNSLFIDGVKNYWEYTYRHGGDPNGRLNSNSVVGQRHDLYQNQEEGGSHFFIPAKAYP